MFVYSTIHTLPAIVKMTKLLITISLILSLSCQNNKSGKDFLTPDKKDINDIVEAVVNQNELLFRDTTILNPSPLSIDLRKLRVTVPDTGEVPPPIDLTSVSIFNLFNALVNHQRFFDRTDSSYFLFQNNRIKTFSIDKAVAEKLVASTSFAEQQRENELNKPTHYYDLTIPILSADNKKAYIEWTTNCSGCGGATAFYLEKINNKWTVVGSQTRWMN